ncbi:hypothetical protein MRB53_038474 [Persea americana]|nr:hypothetical protein MRB53_038474 [Persea americana]
MERWPDRVRPALKADDNKVLSLLFEEMTTDFGQGSFKQYYFFQGFISEATSDARLQCLQAAVDGMDIYMDTDDDDHKVRILENAISDSGRSEGAFKILFCALVRLHEAGDWLKAIKQMICKVPHFLTSDILEQILPRCIDCYPWTDVLDVAIDKCISRELISAFDKVVAWNKKDDLVYRCLTTQPSVNESTLRFLLDRGGHIDHRAILNTSHFSDLFINNLDDDLLCELMRERSYRLPPKVFQELRRRFPEEIKIIAAEGNISKPCSKVLLCLQSPYFEAALNRSSAFRPIKELDCKDTPLRVVEFLIDYVQTSRTEFCWTSAGLIRLACDDEDLLNRVEQVCTTADEYRIPDLAKDATRFMRDLNRRSPEPALNSRSRRLRRESQVRRGEVQGHDRRSTINRQRQRTHVRARMRDDPEGRNGQT